jgi:FMN phosphatase YigB (HAD superfamily)
MQAAAPNAASVHPEQAAGAKAELVVFVDVDNTLLDNDLVRARLEDVMSGLLGEEDSKRFWQIYELVRVETDFVNFPETIARFARACADPIVEGRVSAALYDFAFRDCVYPDSLRTIHHLASFATPVILSDGDQLFQRYKIRAAGLEAAVAGNVLVYVHKEQMVEDIRAMFPARHYVMVDDKARILTAMKEAMGAALTTVMVCQGKYAHDPEHHRFPAPDVEVEGIGGLLEFGIEQLRGIGRAV